MARRLLPLLVAVLFGLPATAQELVRQVPPGMRPDPFYGSSTAERTALAFFASASSNRTRVVQFLHDEETAIKTDLRGRVTKLEYSPDGRRLLAHLVEHEGTKAERRAVTLIDRAGREPWRHDDARPHGFSTNGELVVALGSASRLGGIETFLAADGSRIEEISLDNYLTAALVKGSGDRILFAVRHSLTCLMFGLNKGKGWVHHLDPHEPPVQELRPLAGNRILANQRFGRFLILNWDGEVEYRNDPLQLGHLDLDRTPEHYENLRPYPAANGASVWLFNGNPDAFRLDLDDHRLDPSPADTSAPEGFVISRHPIADRLILVSDHEVRVRPMR